MILRSIRWRFVLWLTFLLTCVLGAFGVAAHRLWQGSTFAQIDAELSRQVALVSSALRGSGGPGGPPGEFGPGDRGGGPPFDRDFERREPPPNGRFGGPPPRGDRGPRGPGGLGDRGEPPGMWASENRTVQLPSSTAQLFSQPDGDYFMVWMRGGRVLSQGGIVPVGLVLPNREGNDTATHLRWRGAFREAWHFTEMGDGVLVGRPIATELAAGRKVAWALVGAGVVVLLFGAGGGWWLARRALAPVGKIGAVASRIAEGDLAERIDARETDSELGQLAGVLNSTFARLEAAFARQRQFTADASHELRTPLAVIISEAQATLNRARTPEEYQQALEVCLEAAQQMRRLTESLLELARFDAAETIERNPVDLAQTARICAELIRPLAAARGVEVHCDLTPAQTVGDANRLQQVVTNLLANAVQYNRAGGEIRLATHIENRVAMLSVADTGQGIAAEDLPHVFERFFRADKSRGRAEGHAGLGLAICWTICDAHGGAIAVESQLGAGSTFTVRLPSVDHAA